MMKIGFPRRQFLRFVAGGVALASVPGIASAQAYPRDQSLWSCHSLPAGHQM